MNSSQSNTDIYRSPCCGNPLYRSQEDWLCEACRRAYPIEGRIPILLLDAAFYKCAGCGKRMPDGDGTCKSCEGAR